MSLKVNIKDASDKFVSLVNCCIVHEHGLHPQSCQKIYKCTAVPKDLYGCETLYTVTKFDILSLERAHRFRIKYILLDFSLTVKAAPYACVIRTGQTKA